jgi:prophage DNA circulation protein
MASIASDETVRTEMLELRVKTRAVLNVKTQNAWRTVDIEPGKTSLSLLNYNYYGNLDNIDKVKKLNIEMSVANMSGTIKTVSK